MTNLEYYAISAALRLSEDDNVYSVLNNLRDEKGKRRGASGMKLFIRGVNAKRRKILLESNTTRERNELRQLAAYQPPLTHDENREVLHELLAC